MLARLKPMDSRKFKGITVYPEDLLSGICQKYGLDRGAILSPRATGDAAIAQLEFFEMLVMRGIGATLISEIVGWGVKNVICRENERRGALGIPPMLIRSIGDIAGAAGESPLDEGEFAVPREDVTYRRDLERRSQKLLDLIYADPYGCGT